jgi:hypothetical protein
MLRFRRPLIGSLALVMGSALALGLAAPAGASATPRPVPQYIIHFSAYLSPPSSGGLAFRSNFCTISPATSPVVAKCQENGVIRLSSTGGNGRAKVSSPMVGINWTFTLVATGPNRYQMSGKGTESPSGPPILRPVRVTGTIETAPTPIPTLKGTQYVFPLSPNA